MIVITFYIYLLRKLCGQLGTTIMFLAQSSLGMFPVKSFPAKDAAPFEGESKSCYDEINVRLLIVVELWNI